LRMEPRGGQLVNGERPRGPAPLPVLRADPIHD
jgi:hypothetical protein